MDRMKGLGFPTSAFVCNQLLILYGRTNKKKFASVLRMMENEDIKPTLSTYRLLIDTKGKMEAEGVKPDIRLQATIARHYAFGGCKEEAEAVLKAIEGDDLNSNRWVYHMARLMMYVERVWKVCVSKPRDSDYLAGIDAWGTLQNIKQAEAVYIMMTQSIKNLTTRHYTAMLEVYAQNKMLTADGRQWLLCWTRSLGLSREALHDAGEVEKADSVLHIATQENQLSSYMCVLDQYKIYHKMKQAEFAMLSRPFSALLQAYINAKAPAYGLRERMKADNIFLSTSLASKN